MDFIAISPYSIKLEIVLIRFNLIEYGKIAMKFYYIIYNWQGFIPISPYSIKLEMNVIRSKLIEYEEIAMKSHHIIYN